MGKNRFAFARKAERCIEVISWIDSASATEGWTVSEELTEKFGIAEIITVGFVVYEDKEFITMVQSVAEDAGSMHDISIPIGCIIKRRKVKFK